MAADWSNLPGPALLLISKLFIFSEDYIRFRSVCKSWRSAAPKLPLLPCLNGYSFKYVDNRYVRYNRLFILTNNHQLIPPIDGLDKLIVINKNNSNSFCGSSYGWIIFYEKCSMSTRILLSNPVTKSEICFPPHPFIIQKLAISNPCNASLAVTVLATFSLPFRIAFCQQGDSVWTEIGNSVPTRNTNGYSYSNVNVIFYKRQFYVRAGLEICICTTGQNPSMKRIPIVNSEGMNLLEARMSNLVQSSSSGDLLLVLLRKRSDLFDVFKVELREDQAKLIKLKSLGDCALFMSGKQLLSFSASQIGCRANCIYRTAFFKGKIIVCNLEDGSKERIPCNHWYPTTWFVPNLLS